MIHDDYILFCTTQWIAQKDIVERCGGNESEAEKMYYEIKRFEEQEADNTLTLFEDGAIGSFYENIDASTGEAYGSHLSVRDILGDFYVNGLIKDKSLQSIFQK